MGNGLLYCYSDYGDLVDAHFVLEKTLKKSSGLWTTMIIGYAVNVCSNEARALF